MGAVTTTFDKTKEEVADKVRKLLAQAEDPAATPEEAQAFTMKAQQLMTKYAIQLAMVADAGRADELTATGWLVPGPYASHKVTLVSAVARSNDCRALYADLGGGRKRIEVVGFASDVEWVQTLSRSLDVQLASALAAGMRERPAHVHGRTYAVGFIQGFIAEVQARLHRARQSAVAAAEAEAARQPRPADGAGSSVALVLVRKRERVEQEFTVRFPSTRTVYSSTRLRSWSGYEPGRAAGRRATISRGAVGDRRRSLSA
jgi:uncharacterized protein DUF2786